MPSGREKTHKSVRPVLPAAAACILTLSGPPVSASAPSYQISVNGQLLDLSAVFRSPYEEAGVVLVSLREMAEALSHTVSPDPEAGTVTIDDSHVQKTTL